MVDFVYSFPNNLPTISLRSYRFPYKGERSSARFNLCIQAIVGDLRVMYNILEEVENEDKSALGVYLGIGRHDEILVPTGD